MDLRDFPLDPDDIDAVAAFIRKLYPLSRISHWSGDDGTREWNISYEACLPEQTLDSIEQDDDATK